MHEQRKPLYVTVKQRALLVEVIDQYVEQTADAKDLTMDDPTVRTADDLLDLMAGYDEDVQLLKDLRLQAEAPRRKLLYRGFPGRKRA